ncbi:MAG TPA: hypothetical protein VFJ81_15475 [Gemmatimonadales bacterium]|nr:hypothetical protein [Gemmatimonadales bacterium]
MPAFRTALLLFPLLGSLACASNPPAGAADTRSADTQSAAVTIDNQAAYDMDIYVHQRDAVVRLGFAPSKQETRIKIPPSFIAGSGIIQFEARPKPSGTPEISDAFTVHPGDQLTWAISPQ